MTFAREDHRVRENLDHFEKHGWMCVPGALPVADAQAMQRALWNALALAGIDRERRETWNTERPGQLQKLRTHAAFRWRPTDDLRQAITTIVGSDFEEPSDWGSAFLAFPSKIEWGVPHKGWHIDANYRSPLSPARGAKTLALLARVKARGGGTQVLSGSHRLVHRWFERNPPPRAARSAQLRALLRAHPYVDALFSRGDAEQRIARFMHRSEDVDGVSLQVVELTGNAGDVFLMHPLLMHAAAPNGQDEPRLMVSGGVTTNMWGWTS